MKGSEPAMIQYTLSIEGMQCGMCESHINDAIRNAFPVKKVESSHKKKQTTILSEKELDESALRAVIDRTGYQVLSLSKAPFEKKGLFPFFRKSSRG